MQASYTFSFLSARHVPVLYDTFMAAFADYVVPIKLTREEFLAKLKREGIEMTFSVGAFRGEELVGFVLTGVGEWQGKPTAYNGGTSVLPAHRGNRLTQQLYSFMLPKLRESGIEQCLLEVIQENKVALHTYRKIGFAVTRTLDTFRSTKQELLLSAKSDNITLSKTTRPNWDAYAAFGDIYPSWQNSRHAFDKSPDEKVVLEAREEGLLVGYMAFFPRKGSIAQLAVAPGRRNKGIATALVREMLLHSQAPAIMAINVDVACTAMLAYFKGIRLQRLLGQYEMVLPLR